MTPKNAEQGQILMELIVAITVILFAAAGITIAIATSVRGTKSTLTQTKAIFLSQGLVESMRALTLEDWNNLDELSTSTANRYFATTTSGKWVSATGTEDILLDNTTYTRSFYVTEVMRSTSTGNIVMSGGIWDPATLRVTTKVTWTAPETGSSEFSQNAYISRNINVIYAQTDWSGGSAGDAVVTGATTMFATSTNVDYASTSGSLKLGEI